MFEGIKRAAREAGRGIGRVTAPLRWQEVDAFSVQTDLHDASGHTLADRSAATVTLQRRGLGLLGGTARVVAYYHPNAVYLDTSGDSPRVRKGRVVRKAGMVSTTSAIPQKWAERVASIVGGLAGSPTADVVRHGQSGDVAEATVQANPRAGLHDLTRQFDDPRLRPRR